jgi:hypothetical protein
MTKIEFVKKVEKVLRIKGFQTNIILLIDGSINGIAIDFGQLKTYRRCIEQTVEPGETLIRIIGTNIMDPFIISEPLAGNGGVILARPDGHKVETSIERYIPEKWIKTESKCHFPKWW